MIDCPNINKIKSTFAPACLLGVTLADYQKWHLADEYCYDVENVYGADYGNPPNYDRFINDWNVDEGQLVYEDYEDRFGFEIVILTTWPATNFG